MSLDEVLYNNGLIGKNPNEGIFCITDFMRNKYATIFYSEKDDGVYFYETNGHDKDERKKVHLDETFMCIKKFDGVYRIKFGKDYGELVSWLDNAQTYKPNSCKECPTNCQGGKCGKCNK